MNRNQRSDDGRRMTRWLQLTAAFGLGTLCGGLTVFLALGTTELPTSPQPLAYPRRIYELNRGRPKTVYIFGQAHPTAGESYGQKRSILRSQAYIALELDRLIRSGKVDRILGEGIHSPDPVPYQPALELTASNIEALLQANPKEVSYSLLKRQYGPGLQLLESSEAGYKDPSGNQRQEVKTRTRLFLGDLMRGLDGRDAIAAVIGLEHIPKLIHDIQVGDDEAGLPPTPEPPHVVLHLTSDDFEEQASWLDHWVPRWDAERTER